MGFKPRSRKVIAGNTLVAEAIQSQNFVTTVSGWQIKADGTAEFGSAIIRGTFSADNGNITADATGFHVVGTARRFDISKTGGYVGRTVPSNGQQVQLVDSGLFLTPPTPTVNANVVGAADIFALVSTAGTVDTPQLAINGDALSGKAAPSIVMNGQTSNSAVDNSVMQLFGSVIIPVSDTALQDSQAHHYLHGENGAFIRPVVAGNTNFIDPVTFSKPFLNPPNVVMNVQDGGSNTRSWMVRAISVTTTGFNSFFFQPSLTPAGASGNPVLTWCATEYTP